VFNKMQRGSLLGPVRHRGLTFELTGRAATRFKSFERGLVSAPDGSRGRRGPIPA
jgi:hypothetical protein